MIKGHHHEFKPLCFCPILFLNPSDVDLFCVELWISLDFQWHRLVFERTLTRAENEASFKATVFTVGAACATKGLHTFLSSSLRSSLWTTFVVTVWTYATPERSPCSRQCAVVIGEAGREIIMKRTPLIFSVVLPQMKVDSMMILSVFFWDTSCLYGPNLHQSCGIVCSFYFCEIIKEL